MSDHEKLDDWLNASATNEAFAQEAKQAWDWSADYKKDFTTDIDDGLVKFKSRLAQEDNTPTVQLQPRNNFLRIAAAIALVLGFGFALQYFMSEKTNMLLVETQAEQTKEISLADGTIVVLNENSTLHYPEKMLGNSRKVELQGEAFFNVAKDASKPFIIETAKTEVEVLGTSFNVKAFTKEATTEVLVKTGKVRFSPKGSDKKLELIANQGATFNSQTRALQADRKASLNGMAWYSKELYFEKTPLNEVIADLEKFFDIDIILKNKSIAHCGYTSTLVKPQLNNILEVLAANFEFEVQQTKANTYQLTGGKCD